MTVLRWPYEDQQDQLGEEDEKEENGQRNIRCEIVRKSAGEHYGEGMKVRKGQVDFAKDYFANGQARHGLLADRK